MVDSDDLMSGFTIELIVISLCFLPISLAQLIIVARYLQAGTSSPMLTVCNVVSGVIGLIFEMIIFIVGLKSYIDGDTDKKKVLPFVSFAIVLLTLAFFFCWYMYGRVLVTADNATSTWVPSVMGITKTIFEIYVLPILFFLVIGCMWYSSGM